MKRISLYVLSTFLSLASFCQDNVLKKNNIFTEILGSGIWYSLNYERVFKLNSLLLATGRVGASYIDSKYLEKSFSLPLSSSILIGKGKNKLELGGSYTYVNGSGSSSENIYSPIIGFRVQSGNGGTMFRINYIPLISEEKEITHSLGVSIGCNF